MLILVAIITSGILAKFYNRPLYVWGPIVATELDDRVRFPTVTLNVGTAWRSVRLCDVRQTHDFSSVLGLITLMQQFNWDEFAFFYTARRNALIPRCALIQSSFDVSNNDLYLLHGRSAYSGSYGSEHNARVQAEREQ